MQLRGGRKTLMTWVAALAGAAAWLNGASSAGAQDALMCRTEGEGPPLVFLHDLGASGESWVYPRFVFRHDHRVIVVDFPGHGETPPVAGDLTIDDLVTAVEATVAAHVNDPCTLVGHGLGGIVALKYALRHPERLRGLVVVDQIPRAELTAEQAERYMRDIEFEYHNFAPQLYLSAWVSRQENFQRRVLESAIKVAPSTYLQLFKDFQHVDLSESLKDIRVPTLVVYQPGWIPSRSHEEYVAYSGYDKIRGVTFKRIEDAGHFLMYDQYTEFNRALHDFLWRVERREDADPGTVTTPSGLKYVDVEVGEGAAPRGDSVVTVHTVGRLADGTVITGSDSRSLGRPWRKTVEQGFLDGVSEGLLTMRAGGRRKMIIPPHLGYGLVEYANVPRGSTVIFDVELLKVEPPPAPPVLSDAEVRKSTSGVEYIELAVGGGPQPTDDSIVEFECIGWYADGTYAGGSFEPGEPYRMLAKSTPEPAWSEAMLDMRVGGSRLLFPHGRAALQSGAADASDTGPKKERADVAAYQLTLVEIVSPDRLRPTDASGLPQNKLPSGVIFTDLVVGSGDVPDDEVKSYNVEYTCWLKDGTFVESTRLKSRAPMLRADQLPPGLLQGMSTMRAGGVRQIIVPPELAHGAEGKPPTVPPNATLIYEVRLRYFVR